MKLYCVFKDFPFIVIRVIIWSKQKGFFIKGSCLPLHPKDILATSELRCFYSALNGFYFMAVIRKHIYNFISSS